MSEELKWIIGLALASMTSFTGMLIGAFYNMAARVRAGDEVLAAKIDGVGKTVKEGDDALHQRINRTRDEYVRRDDLDAHISRIYSMMTEQRTEAEKRHEATMNRLDKIIEATRSA